jgi:tetratricopeptide (TPR) repeat protein
MRSENSKTMRRLLRLIPGLAALLLIASAPGLLAAAQKHDHAASPGSSAAISICTAPGFGKIHHPVKTSNPQAQRLFEQAMALDYGFNHNQAEQCFRQASQADPEMAMAYWGIALVLGTNYNLPVDGEREKLAYENVQKALTLSANGPRNERDYIEALAKRYTDQPNPDYDRLEAAYHDAMREVYKRYPDDLDAATLFAESGMNLHPWQLYDRSGKPAPGTGEIVDVLESVLKRDPNHLGANHFYIHAVEASIHAGVALPSAQRLAGLAPASGHLVHMPAHVYIRTGDHERGAKTNVAAVRVDDAYFAAAHPQGVYPLMYYTHNLHFIAAENAYLGNYASSLQAAKRAQEHVAPYVKEMSMVDPFYSLPLQIMVRFHRWDEIIALPQPDASHPVSAVAWHYARALAAAKTSKLDEARSELAALRAAAPAMAKIPLNSTGLHNSEVIPQMMSEMVEARLARAQNETDAAITHLQSAVLLEDTLDYNEPPDWLAPTRESLGAMLLQTGKAAEAETVFREDLKRNPRNPRSVFGLAEALKAEHKVAEAAAVRQQFQRAWKNADTKLTLSEM